MVTCNKTSLISLLKVLLIINHTYLCYQENVAAHDQISGEGGEKNNNAFIIQSLMLRWFPNINLIGDLLHTTGSIIWPPLGLVRVLIRGASSSHVRVEIQCYLSTGSVKSCLVLLTTPSLTKTRWCSDSKKERTDMVVALSTLEMVRELSETL